MTKLQRAAVLGSGRAGSALLRSLAAAKVDVTALGARSTPNFVPDGCAIVSNLEALTSAMLDRAPDVLFLAVPDRALAEVDRGLARASALPPLIVHLSGARGAEAFSTLAQRGAKNDLGQQGQTDDPSLGLASFHPLAALRKDQPIPIGTVVGIHANKASAHAALETLAKAMSLLPVAIKSGAHPGYHLGATVAANLPLALLELSSQRLCAAGLNKVSALRAAVALMQSALDNVRKQLDGGVTDLSQALTGPIARGDAETVRQHLAVIERLASDAADDQAEDKAVAAQALAQSYRALSRLLVKLADISAHEATELSRDLESN